MRYGEDGYSTHCGTGAVVWVGIMHDEWEMVEHQTVAGVTLRRLTWNAGEQMLNTASGETTLIWLSMCWVFFHERMEVAGALDAYRHGYTRGPTWIALGHFIQNGSDSEPARATLTFRVRTHIRFRSRGQPYGVSKHCALGQCHRNRMYEPFRLPST